MTSLSVINEHGEDELMMLFRKGERGRLCASGTLPSWVGTLTLQMVRLFLQNYTTVQLNSWPQTLGS